jgi:Protein of unknown function (DUF3727)/Protein of unknown function (DUF1292)
MSKNFPSNRSKGGSDIPPNPPKGGANFSPEYDDDDLETIILTDEQGKELECYVEHSLEYGYYNYLLLQPVDLPIIILGKDNEDDEEEEVFFIEEEEELEQLFGDAKAVLGELNLTLKHTAFTLTASGELPPLEEEDILTLEIDEDNESINPEELQFLASFYNEKKKYEIYTPLAPLMFFARQDSDGDLELISPEDQEIQPILEELLFDELD